MTAPTYPSAPQVAHTDEYHGTCIADPYRWLENPDSPETRAWIEAENALTFDFLGRIESRGRIKERLTQLWDYERYSVPFRQGGRYFWFRNDGLQNQSVLYTAESLDGEARVLLDPNTLSPDGTVALSGLAVSEDGARMAYGLSNAGSDWQEWQVRDIASGKDAPDRLRWVKFSGASWTHDGLGFFYSRYDPPSEGEALQGVNYYQKLCYHRLGMEQDADEIVYNRPDEKEWGFGGHVTEDGQYLLIHVWRGTDPKNAIFYKDLTAPDAPVVELFSDFDAAYGFIGNEGPVFWFVTDLKAPRRRVLAVDTRQPERENWREIIPQSEETLQGVSLVGDQFFASYLQDARAQVRTFSLGGALLGEVPLPGLGSVSGFGGKRRDAETFYSFTSFAVPPTIYRYDIPSATSTVFRQPLLVFDPADYEASQTFYTSKDGTRVPMFLAHKRGLRRDGGNPTYLYGYGGFGASLTPSFSVPLLAWMEMGGLVAIPNLRGGGEYGEEWHQAGTKTRKQNVFDDFLAAAQWLIDNGYTATPKLAIGGGSNGGLLVGACLTQRPDLFGAALPAVGVLDMLRFHQFTIGWAWTTDYGSADDPEQFAALLAYSPLHNIRSGTCYPATLITTADHDDRVVPAHSFKFAAALQAAQAGTSPILIRIETQAGHGGGKPTAKAIEEAADRWAFLTAALCFEPD
ncbi:MAG: S9 family peptidase [Armatimonadetes bacterium]|nr:S9 family peptidase [Armatimonadota bacterium]